MNGTEFTSSRIINTDRMSKRTNAMLCYIKEQRLTRPAKAYKELRSEWTALDKATKNMYKQKANEANELKECQQVARPMTTFEQQLEEAKHFSQRVEVSINNRLVHYVDGYEKFFHTDTEITADYLNELAEWYNQSATKFLVEYVGLDDEMVNIKFTTDEAMNNRILLMVAAICNQGYVNACRQLNKQVDYFKVNNYLVKQLISDEW